ncbi:hypothetical protein M0657_009184 [Pyricularia oryzae]|uniref:Uncharacterized protein n=2 Tax=Pyricularia oryzae TaxID=318829 RepID=A0AA97P192_PYRO3|nr:hypothetical protein OOU_Y34scaffold00462g19 [Pyricularia oryzae Y34]KAI7914378.1 hypothetical protein M9X92_009020 [Pyricularia oryzae]KAI7915186.1 hypothetical protein M0657_009184 [Pyricularia oryzae]
MDRVASMKRHDVDRWYRVTFSLASPSYFFGVAAEYWTDFKAICEVMGVQAARDQTTS